MKRLVSQNRNDAAEAAPSNCSRTVKVERVAAGAAVGALAPGQHGSCYSYLGILGTTGRYRTKRAPRGFRSSYHRLPP